MERKIDARRGAWKKEKSFLPSLDAPQTHKILSINQSANTEKDRVRVSKIVKTY